MLNNASAINKSIAEANKNVASSDGISEDIDALLKRLNEQEDIIEKKSEVIASLKRRVACLEEYLRLDRARRFAPSSEKNPHQMEFLFNEAETEEEAAATQKALDELKAQNSTKPNKKRGRKGLSKNLPRHQHYINLSDEEKAGAIDTFYVVVKEELDIEPAKARVIEYLQEKAVFNEVPTTNQADLADNADVTDSATRQAKTKNYPSRAS